MRLIYDRSYCKSRALSRKTGNWEISVKWLRRSAPVASQQVLKQDDGVVTGAITSGKQQSQRATIGVFEELSNKIILVAEFLEIPRSKFTEFGSIVIEPLSPDLPDGFALVLHRSNPLRSPASDRITGSSQRA